MRLAVRHTAHVMGTAISFRLAPPADTPQARIAGALGDALAELRLADQIFSTYRADSLVSGIRRGELDPHTLPGPVGEVIQRCAEVTAATDGWFDPWCQPGGFDPSGLVKGWALERAGLRLREAGFTDYAISGGGDITARGTAAHGAPWRVGIRHPGQADQVVMVLSLADAAVATSAAYERGSHIIAPATGQPCNGPGSATVVGPDLGIADAYATALFAAGEQGMAWFGTGDYQALSIGPELSAVYTEGLSEYRLS